MSDLQEGRFIRNVACPDCGSKDNLSVYQKKNEGGELFTDGFCHSCDDAWKSPEQMEEWGYNEAYEVETVDRYELDKDLIDEIHDYDARGWRSRRIGKDTYDRYDCKAETDENDTPVWYYYPVSEQGKIVGYKRKFHKKISKEGKSKRPQSNVGRVKLNSSELFGQKLFNKGGKFLVITEGEDDALAFYQAMKKDNSKYETAVVSIGFGAGNALRHIQTNYEWVTSFSNVIIAFDSDEHGKKAQQEVLRILKPGQGKFIDFKEFKDAGEYVEKGHGSKLVRYFWEAESFSPAGIVGSSQTLDAMLERASFEKIPLPGFASKLEDMLNGGFALGEITTVAAASSTGKTSIVNEFLYHFIFNSPYKVGVISLESDVGELTENLMSLHTSTKLANMCDDDKKFLYNTPNFVEKHRHMTTKSDGTDRYYILDHQGAVVDGELMDKIEYMVKVLECKVIILDPLTLALSGKQNDGMDIFMSDLLRFVKRERIHHVNVVHVRKNAAGSRANSTGADIHEEDIKGCTDKDTEFLSPNGWVKIGDWDGEQVAQWRMGQMSFVKPLNYIKLPCNDGLYHFTNKTSIDMMLSSEHRMLLGDKVRLVKDVIQSVGRAELPVKFNAKGNSVDRNRVRLLVACAADACYHGNGLAKAEFRKERKVNRFKELLENLDIDYSSSVDRDGDTTYRFKALTESKLLHECYNWYSADSDTLNVFIDECIHWDGTVNESTGERVFYTSVKEEADVVQFAAHACGFVARIREYSGHYHVSIAQESSPKNKVMMRSDSVEIEKVDSIDGYKYCFEVPSSFFIARRNGKIFVTGNSGALFQVSMNNILLMRDKESDNEIVRNTTKVVMSKARRTGNTGPAGYWYYDNETARLSEGSDPHGNYMDDEEIFKDTHAFDDIDAETAALNIESGTPSSEWEFKKPE